eukprot:CAMPEP_0203917148 /NCGR_PEP_ID=MMETSP0359-20131031/57783_1 /ASSEMBLY_ACC=CAM_ASM_000338 /TAXON_ID=268821 /ORGANISM="Scrippsiella Hangoei, Strain SHTV-5" /LENGTH=390 /DNA_ID=CAMNT_0050843983 /DNA_START=95 /DNA_END=1267 /DNA_ORIENTATION=-
MPLAFAPPPRALRLRPNHAGRFDQPCRLSAGPCRPAGRRHNSRTARAASSSTGTVIGAAAGAATLTVLGLKSGASVAELRRAYRQKAKEWHPDAAERRGINPREAARRFVEVNEAYRALLHSLGPAPASAAEEDDSEDELPEGLGLWDGRFSWELSAAEVKSMREGLLRAVLWNSLGWGLRRGASNRLGASLPPLSAGRRALEDALLPLLDEVVRRDVLVTRAERAGDVAEIERLRAKRSLRHRLRDECMEVRAAQGEGSPEAETLRERFETLTEARADVTSDEGGYPVEWDQKEEEVAAFRRARRKVASAIDGAETGDNASSSTSRGSEQEPGQDATDTGDGILRASQRATGLTGFFRLAAKAAARRTSAAAPIGASRSGLAKRRSRLG